MDVQQTWYLVPVVFVAAVVCAAGILWCRLARRRAYVIDGFRLELHDAHPIEDRFVEVVWRAAISMTNKTRRPRHTPIIAERATVASRRKTYLAHVYLDTDATELNPDDVALAWVEFVLPADIAPRRWSIVTLRARRRPRAFSFAARVIQPANGLEVRSLE